MLRIEVIGKRKREMRIQPAVVRVPAFFAFADIDHGPPPGSCKRIILVITTIVKRYMYASLLSPPPSARPGLQPTLCLCELCTAPSASFRRRPLLVYSDNESAAPQPRGFFNGLPIVRNDDEKARGLCHAPRNAHHHRQSHRQILRSPRHARHHSRRGPPPDQG